MSLVHHSLTLSSHQAMMDAILRERTVDAVRRTNSLFIETSNPYIPRFYFTNQSLKSALKYSIEYKQSTNIVLKTGESSKDEGLDVAPLLVKDVEADGNPQPVSKGMVAVARKEAEPKQKLISNALVKREPPKVPIPQWHAPWELSAVVSGHLGWVRSIAFDASNEWFATGSADRTIKIWDLAKCCAGAEGGLKLTLTGHINAIRGLAVSPRHPYLFSAGEDKMVKCWDLEYNKVIRHYHGHLSGVFALALHPILDILFTGGRDSVCRVWDIRTKNQIHVLGGHSGAVSSIVTNTVDPQVLTASHDSTVKLWDLAAGKSISTLTQHKKAVRALVGSSKEFTFISAGADNVKKWQTRDGKFLRNMSDHSGVINCLALNDDGVLVAGGDNGALSFWDYDSGYSFQHTQTICQPGSLDAEAGIYAAAFDLSGSRLITCEADKSIKIWRESREASEDTHPVDMKKWTQTCQALKKY